MMGYEGRRNLKKKDDWERLNFLAMMEYEGRKNLEIMESE